MSKKNRGFTLVELMGVVAVLGLIALGVLTLGVRALRTGGGMNQQEATEQAFRFAADNMMSGATVSCMEGTNKRGNVDCTMSVPIRGSLPVIYGLECGAAFNMNGQKGCRIVSQPMHMGVAQPIAPP